jgi:predicted nucleotidyltransferase
MGTNDWDNAIGPALFSKNRRAILALLFGNTEQAFYLRQIVRACGGGVGAIQRELRQLTDTGILTRVARGRHVYFQANDSCPIFSELKSLMVKTAGVADVLRVAMAPIADRIVVAFIFGSVARMEQRSGSDIDILVVGDVAFAQVVEAVSKVQEHLGREVNPVVYPLEEFKAKIAAGHHFLAKVLTQSKIFLIGDEDELTRVAPKRLVDGA